MLSPERRTRILEGVAELNKDPADEQPAPELKARTLDAWSWIARARQAAARTVAPVPPSSDGRVSDPAPPAAQDPPAE